jgi:hypothetical protein
MSVVMRVPLLLLAVAFLQAPAFAIDPPAGVVGDGKTDVTTALQAALDAAGRTGGAVELPPGQYLIGGALSIPTGVTLKGSWEAPHHGAYDKGSTLLLTGGRGNEKAPPAITLQQSSAILGFTLLWPEQRLPEIVPYPWAIQGVGMHNTVENVTLVNAYNGIRIGNLASSELHLIRNVFGCVLRRGIFIDSTTDIGRIENVHFNPHYWARSRHDSLPKDGDPTRAAAKYMTDHLEAFLFGRADWEYVSNTFVFAAKIGYRFIKTPAGAMNGQLMGIGADDCRTCVQIDDIQPIGLQFTNGEFTAFAGEPNTGVATSPEAAGAAQFVNCNFWATPGAAARLEGSTAVTFSDSRFLDVPEAGAIVATNGRLIVRGCSFAKSGTAVRLGKGVKAAILTDNLQEAGFRVVSEIGRRAQVAMNEAPPSDFGNYRVRIGAAGDTAYLGQGWEAAENAGDAPEEIAPAVRNTRWTNGHAELRLPVRPGRPAVIDLWLRAPHAAAEQEVAVAGSSQPEKLKEGAEKVTLAVPATESGLVTLSLTGPTWQPSQSSPGSKDKRQLGVRVYAVDVREAGRESDPLDDVN